MGKSITAVGVDLLKVCHVEHERVHGAKHVAVKLRALRVVDALAHVMEHEVMVVAQGVPPLPESLVAGGTKISVRSIEQFSHAATERGTVKQFLYRSEIFVHRFVLSK